MTDHLTLSIVTRYDQSIFDTELRGWYQSLSGVSSLKDRLMLASQNFYGKSYLRDPLGEGVRGRFDQNPLYRTDAVDCLSFLNIVLAMGLSPELDQFASCLQQLRYRGGEVHYVNRHCFMCVDWNEAHQASGLVHDLTSAFVNKKGEALATTAEAYIDRPAWIRAHDLRSIKRFEALPVAEAATLLSELHAYADQLAARQSSLSYLPFDCLLDQKGFLHEDTAETFPDVSIIEFVRPNWVTAYAPGTHVNVSHVGFLFRRDDELFFRHASQDHGYVLEELFSDYLRYCLSIPSLAGIHVLGLSDLSL